MDVLKNRRLLLLIFLAFILRLFLAQFFTHYGDLMTFKAWALKLAEDGFGNFYSTIWSDYLPGYLYILWLLGSISQWLQANAFYIPDEIYYKLPSMIADIGTALYGYLIVKRFASVKSAFIVTVIYLFNPAILANSTFWGQADSFATFFLVSSFYYLIIGKFWLSAIIIGFGQIVKPVAIFSIPVYLLFLWIKKISYQQIVVYICIILFIVITSFLPFSTNKPNVFEFIIERHLITANQYPFTSLNAFNFWAYTTNFWIEDKLTFLDLSFHDIGFILFGAVYIALLFYSFNIVKKSNNPIIPLIFIFSLIYFSMFLFLTRIHERHMFYGIAFSSILLVPIISRLNRLLILGLHVIYVINLYFAYKQLYGTPPPFDYSYVIIFSIVNLLLFSSLLLSFIFNNVRYANK